MADVPVDKVLQLRSQGSNDQQIIQMLQGQGFDPPTINEAISQANAKNSADASAAPNPQANIQQPPSEDDDEYEDDDDGDESSEIEELIEEIIEEKWKELVKDIKKIIEWKDKVDERMSKLEQGFEDLKGNFDNLHNSLMGKIGEYDKNIVQVGTEIKAMEKVFEKVLPKFTENVNELSRVTKNIKSKGLENND